MKNKQYKVKIPKPRNVTLKPRTCQPSKKELEETMDMPGMSEKEIREIFLFQAKIRPGLRMPCGSRLSFSLRISSISASPRL